MNTENLMTQADKILNMLSLKMEKAFQAVGENREMGEEASVVMVRTLQADPDATANDLKLAWYEGLSARPNEEVIELVLALHTLFGPKWNDIYLHRYLLQLNDDCRGEGETRENCALFGDTVEEVQDYWERISEEFDARREDDEAAQERQAKKAA